MSWTAILLVGGGVGFVAGLFGAGGSAVGTPLLHLAGVPAFVALASPLPTAVPVALVSSGAYRKRGFLDRRVLAWSVAVGLPATVGGALLTSYLNGQVLVRAVDVVVAAIGLRLAAFPRGGREQAGRPRGFRFRLISVAAVAGVVSGLLANSGGFLLAPLYLMVLNLPIKRALATSLAVSAALALPGTVTHWALGHIDWRVVLAYTVLAVPAAYLGARVAVLANPDWLTRLYGVALVLVASALLLRGG